MLIKIVILQLLISCVTSVLFPGEITKCSYGDSKCISETINDIFENKYQGFSQLGLPTLDPLRIDQMDLNQNKKSPVNIELNFRNVTFSGLSKARIYKLSGFNKNPQGNKLDIRFKSPRIEMFGPYKTVGRVLLLPIQGDGISNITLDDVDFVMRLHTKAVERNGKVYMQILKSKLNFETSRLYMSFSNLFNGNEALGTNMNLFLNENWKDILNELKTPIIDGFGGVFIAIINHVFNTFAYSDVFSN